ncbi:MAG: SRPBCC family protein [Acidimicrobiales bacterium]|nr:SRPBCC family protein [Acidimicrobiales bacterium]
MARTVDGVQPCDMGTLTPQGPDWIHTAPYQPSATRDLDASPAEVFAALIDHENWPKWFTNIERVERFGDQHEGVGSHRRVHINKRVAIDEEFNVWEPNERWGFTILSATIGGLNSMNELVTIEDLGDDRSRVTYTMGIDAKLLVAPLLKVGRKAVQKNLANALDNLGPYIVSQRPTG